jgi:hypothetical protein
MIIIIIERRISQFTTTIINKYSKEKGESVHFRTTRKEKKEEKKRRFLKKLYFSHNR